LLWDPLFPLYVVARRVWHEMVSNQNDEECGRGEKGGIGGVR